MVGWKREVGWGKGWEMKVGKLVGVKIERNIMWIGRIEKEGDLIRKEGNELEKKVKGIGKKMLGNGGKNVVDKEVDIGWIIEVNLGGKRVREEESGEDRKVKILEEKEGWIKRFDLDVEVEKIEGF